ncbi:MAG: hypothetical protein R3E68_12210 [Burkholderiaceae bacterium]
MATTWAVLGAATIVAPFWGERFRRSRGGAARWPRRWSCSRPAQCCRWCCPDTWLLASAALVGGSIFMVPAAVTLLVRNELPAPPGARSPRSRHAKVRDRPGAGR